MDKLKLNNKLILLRNLIKPAINQTKLILMRKIKKAKERRKNVDRKMSELECFKRITKADINLSQGLHPERLQKVLTNPSSLEFDRVIARVLLNDKIQKGICNLKEHFDMEMLENFMQNQERKMKKPTSKLKLCSEKNDKKIIKEPKAKTKKATEPTGDQTTAGRFVKISHDMQVACEDIEKNETRTLTDSFFVDLHGNSYITFFVEENCNEDESSHKNELSDKITTTRKKNAISDNKCKEKSNGNHSKKEKLDASTDDIHPSWKAKQELKKSQIREFKGTKIKFDDE